MTQKYFVLYGYGDTAKTKEFDRYEDMIECVRKHYVAYEYLPVVYFGKQLEFEPAEIIKSWKIKESR